MRPFGTEVALTTPLDAEVVAGLERLAHPPDWLTSIEDPARLRADLERTIPELSSGTLTLVACKFKRAHVDGGSWTSLCRLKLEDRDGARREVDVRGRLVPPGAPPPAAPAAAEAFGVAGWTCYLPDLRWELTLEPSDGALPAMEPLTDPEQSRVLLEAALRAGATERADLRLAASTPTVMRYREGRRCTIRYELGYGVEGRQPEWPTGVVAKVYEGDEGQVTYDGMRALWASPLGASAVVTIAEPLAFLADRNVLIQGLVPGARSLKEQIKTAFAPGLQPGVDALSEPVRKAGHGLAELHASHAAGGPELTWATQVAAVDRAVDELAGAVPALAGAMQPLVASLDALAHTVPAGPLVATHRSFRPAQVLVDGDDIAFIDFDGFCQAEAGLDLALFRTTLTDLSLRALEKDAGEGPVPHERPDVVDALDGLCATFLAGYEEVSPVARDRLACWDALTSAKDIVDVWRKIKFEHLPRRMALLQRRLGMEVAPA